MESNHFLPKFNDLLNEFRLILCEKQVPKGFDKYFPKNGKNANKSANKSSKTEPKSEPSKEAPPKQSKPQQSSGQSSKPKEWKFEYNFNFGGKGDEPNKWTNIALVTTLGVLGLYDCRHHSL